jgi:hypothetical protein
MPTNVPQRPPGAKEIAAPSSRPNMPSGVQGRGAVSLGEQFPEFAWLGPVWLERVGRDRLAMARNVVRYGGYEPRSPELLAALEVPPDLADCTSAASPVASELADAAYEQCAVANVDGTAVNDWEAEPVIVAAAATTVATSGTVEARPSSQRPRRPAADVERRMRRRKGYAPPGKSLEARRQHVAVRIFCDFFARLVAPPVVLPDGTRLSAEAATLLSRAGLVEAQGARETLERHPRARPVALDVPDAVTGERLARDLEAVSRGEYRAPDETTKPLPESCSAATLRNRRRMDEAWALYEEEKLYARQQDLERARKAGGSRVRNPAGVKRLPLAEGRKARAVAWDRREAEKFLKSVPFVLRARLYAAATNGGRRGHFSPSAMLVYAAYAFFLWQSETPRPAMRRDGYDRAVEGLSREALAVAFVWNPETRQPYHANTMSALVAVLEGAGLVVRESPNSDDDAYTGVTGWALNVYRLRNGEQLAVLLLARGIELPLQEAEVEAPLRAVPS